MIGKNTFVPGPGQIPKAHCGVADVRPQGLLEWKSIAWGAGMRTNGPWNPRRIASSTLPLNHTPSTSEAQLWSKMSDETVASI